MSDVTVNPGYALGQLQRALATALGHANPATRARAQEKMARWNRVLEGMAAGALSIGSRTPVDAPAWATLEVITGGFATGGLLAGGPLQADEEERLATIPSGDGTPRARLNAWFLGDDGQKLLRDAFASGAFRVRLPEEGALLVVTWLLARGHGQAALDVLGELLPFMDRLRFYPVLGEDLRPAGALVRLRTAGEVAADTAAAQPPAQVARMYEALQLWNPLQDRLVALWLETVEGEPPRNATDEDGALIRDARGQPVPAGGWPGRVFPAGWHARAAALLAEVKALPATPPNRFAFRLLPPLSRANRLSEAEAREVRRVLAAVLTRHGAPGEDRHTVVRAEQARVASQPLHADLSKLVSARLRSLPKDGGLPALEPLLVPVTEDEHRRTGLPEGAPVPRSLLRKVQRALEAPVDELIERGVIGSAEVLAIVLPQITAEAQASGVADPELRRVFSAIYGAFRRRRSLLLLHLEHQVRIEELPWVAALTPFREDTVAAADAARATLEQAATLAITRFPETILPNKLLTELAALAATAKLNLPLVEEIAADIFMGEFSAKFQTAAKRAARLLDGRLYAWYYDIPVAEILALPEPANKPKKWGVTITPGFRDLCVRRARASGPNGSVAQNGTVLEQAQILTTHNLAVLFDAFDLGNRLRGVLPVLADQCLDFVLRQHAIPLPAGRARLQMTKNTAYAWRQMLFFLSFVGAEEQAAFRTRAQARFAEEAPEQRERLAPILAGLWAILDGRAFGPDDRAGGGRRFLGWSVGGHWLYP